MTALSLRLAQAIAHDESGLVVDLSEVRLMSAETVGVLSRTRDYLRLRSRLLTLRSPSTCVSQVLEACDLYDLLDRESVEETGAAEPAAAHGRGVSVSPSDRVERHMDPAVPTQSVSARPVIDRRERSSRCEKSVAAPEEH
jgi:anti-anti-sigma regulatory factor